MSVLKNTAVDCLESMLGLLNRVREPSRKNVSMVGVDGASGGRSRGGGSGSCFVGGHGEHAIRLTKMRYISRWGPYKLFFVSTRDGGRSRLEQEGNERASRGGRRRAGDSSPVDHASDAASGKGGWGGEGAGGGYRRMGGGRCRGMGGKVIALK